MKRNIILVVITLVAATAIAFVSCKKDKDNEKSKSSECLAMNHEPSEMDKAMMAFGNRMKSAALEKSGETMSLAEALTTLSNYQNFSMCDASYYSTEMTVDTFRVSLNVTNGEVSLSDLYDVYETTETQILSRLASLDGNQKAVYSIWCFVAEATKGDLDDYTGSLDVDVVSHIRGNIDPGNTLSFDTTAYWYDFDSLGQCGIYAGQNVGDDCVTKLNQMLHARRPSIDIPGFRVYFTNMQYYSARAIDYPDSSSPNGHYAWPWRFFWDNEQCVSPSEMNYYLSAIENDMADLESQYYNSLVEFLLDEHSYWKEPNQNKEAFLNYTIAEVHYTPLPNN